jgi:hypothetical protein
MMVEKTCIIEGGCQKVDDDSELVGTKVMIIRTNREMK